MHFRTGLILFTIAACLLPGPGAEAATPRLSRIDAVAADYAPAAMAIHGRVAAAPTADAGEVRFQWPGIAFETAFRGDGVAFSFGPGEVIVHVSVDGRPLETLVKPVGPYRISGLGDEQHRVRIDVASESQAGPNRFDGFLLPAAATPMPLPATMRRIEFIGDSHTVGYGNLSPHRECTEAEVWASTDTTQAFGPRVARHFAADYRITAVSGRGIMRNFDGGPGDTLPRAYPFVLFDHSVVDTDATWQPQLVVIALGTNDFSTPLKAGEPWASRAALHADYRRTYVAFVQSLRQRYPHAAFVLWATDGAAGEIRAQVKAVVSQLRQAGETRVSFLAVDGLSMTGCHWHPSAIDHARIAELLVRHVEALPLPPW